jgi:hypothetical protein
MGWRVLALYTDRSSCQCDRHCWGPPRDACTGCQYAIRPACGCPSLRDGEVARTQFAGYLVAAAYNFVCLAQLVPVRATS